MKKKYFRCTVCQDIHFGNEGPEVCPTCKQENKYIEVDKEEAQLVMENN
ncbi:hypothetical protein KY334_03025 [Candidatus Woesearchaeota archaeon]|nr:hypothetical protein [Candidatus Woesearchaeota archaeon]